MGRRHGNRLVSRVDRALGRLHQQYENLNYDILTNGERWVLHQLEASKQMSVVFDVGAHVGGWGRVARARLPQAEIHCFELVPATKERLAANLSGYRNVHVHDVGLSDHGGSTVVNCATGYTDLSTLVDGAIESFFGIETQQLTARVTTGDRFCAEHDIKQIDFLKIDVEGAEYDVLTGFHQMLSSGAIKVVQFEYGYVNILTKRLLRDFHQLLEGAGMTVGKIYPNHVEFRPYRVQHEDFLGPNFLAVRRSEEQLIAALS